jgi:hypothetical protein
MRTMMRVIRIDGTHDDRDWGDMPEKIGIDDLEGMVEPYLDDGQRLDHVYVSSKGMPPGFPVSPDYAGPCCSMFIGKFPPPRWPVNAEGTRLFRWAWLDRNPKMFANELPSICGTVVLFNRMLWY